MLKLPPYGSYLHNMLSKNFLPTNDVYVFIGQNAWKKAQAFQSSKPTTLCLPPDSSPYMFNWPVKECDILAFDTSNTPPELIEEFGACLLSFGANIIRVISTDFITTTTFKKEFENV